MSDEDAVTEALQSTGRMAGKRDHTERWQYSLRSLWVMFTLAGGLFAILRLGMVAILLVPAYVVILLALKGKARATLLGILLIMIAVAIGVGVAILSRLP